MRELMRLLFIALDALIFFFIWFNQMTHYETAYLYKFIANFIPCIFNFFCYYCCYQLGEQKLKVF